MFVGARYELWCNNFHLAILRDTFGYCSLIECRCEIPKTGYGSLNIMPTYIKQKIKPMSSTLQTHSAHIAEPHNALVPFWDKNVIKPLLHKLHTLQAVTHTHTHIPFEWIYGINPFSNPFIPHYSTRARSQSPTLSSLMREVHLYGYMHCAEDMMSAKRTSYEQ